MVEEPIRSDDTAGYIRLTKELGGIKVAGIESEQGVSRFAELIKAMRWMWYRHRLGGQVVLPDAEILHRQHMHLTNYTHRIRSSLQL